MRSSSTMLLFRFDRSSIRLLLSKRKRNNNGREPADRGTFRRLGENCQTSLSGSNPDGASNPNSVTYWIFLLEAALRGFAEVEDLCHAMQHMDERFQEPPTRGSRCGAPSAGLDTRWACVWRQDLRDRVWSLAREHQVEIFDAGLRQTEGESSGSGGDIVLSADRIRDHFVL